MRKLLVQVDGGSSAEICSQPAHRQCPTFLARKATPEDPAHCPLLHESIMQYCAAQPVPKLVPYSDSQLSRCGSDSFPYCELYLQMARPSHRLAAGPTPPSEEWEVDGIRVPARLYFTRNHMWLDSHPSGACHIGIDGFLARLIGRLDSISFVTQRGVHRPSVVLTVNGADWPIVFPNSVLLSGANLYLRGNPSRLTADPYGAAWLFEGWEPPSSSHFLQGLLHGPQALAWMSHEVRRLSEFVQQSTPRREGALSGTGSLLSLCDGGVFVPGLFDYLSRDERFSLLHEFFDPPAAWPDRL